jgi:hypothetical protein
MYSPRRHVHWHRVHGRTSRGRNARLLAIAAIATLPGGCGTGHPKPLDSRSLAEAQTFPYFVLYWTGPRFEGRSLTAVDGRQSYNSSIGDSVYYGDCIAGKKTLGGGGSCGLPLRVTTVIYRLHSNAALGPQRNVLLRGVPATVYDDGRSIELYSGRVAIDVSSEVPSSAMRAVEQLQPLNAPPSNTYALAPPVYCPGLTGWTGKRVRMTLAHLPGHPCQRAQAALAARGRAAEGPMPRS